MTPIFKGKKIKDLESLSETLINNSLLSNNIFNRLNNPSFGMQNKDDDNADDFIEKRKNKLT